MHVRRSAAFSLLVASGFLTTISQAQSVGLYKDGRKVIDFEKSAVGPTSRKASILAQVPSRLDALGAPNRDQFAEQRDYFADLLRCRDLVLSATDDDADIPRPTINELLSLRSNLLEKNSALLEKFEIIGVDLVSRGYPAEKRERHAAVMARYREAADGLLGLLTELAASANPASERAALARLREFFEGHVFEPKPRLFNSQPLPVSLEAKRKPEVLVREPGERVAPTAPGVSPRTEAVLPPDLEQTIDVQFTPEITDLATQLNHSAPEIYEYVHNTVTFEPYLGSRKGSQQTLDHLRGNDYDQASLLIALLRISGIPSRYVSGTVEMPIDRATNWLGIDDPIEAATMLNTAGFSVVLVVDGGGQPVAIRCRRVWVQAYVPHVNYRGAVNDSVGKRWTPLDPAFKQYVYDSAINLPEEVAFDAEAFVEDYYSTFHTETPVELFRQMLLDSLSVRHPGLAEADLIRSRTVMAETDGILPGTLPYKVLSIDPAFSAIPASARYGIRFHVYGGGTNLDYTTNLPAIVNKQVTISYVGATAADQAIIDSAGGIFNVTTPWLVDLKPVLKIDGCEVARGTGAVGMGIVHNSDMQFLPPTGAQNQIPFVYNTITAGNYQGIGIDTEDALPAVFEEVVTSCTEGYMGEVVHQTALTYLNNVDIAGDEAANLMHLVVLNDVSEAVVENTVRVLYDGFGNPLTFDWTGMIVDADRKIIGPFSVEGLDNSCDYMRLGGADGSIQENRLFESVFGEEAISAIKILELAGDSGIAVCKITTSIPANCPTISQPASVINAINAALAAGHDVIIPRRGFTYYNWTGTGWIDIDPVSCAAGYIISGGQNGGATVQEWDVDMANAICFEPSGGITVTPSAPSNMYWGGQTDNLVFTVGRIDYKGFRLFQGGCYDVGTETNKEFHVAYTIKQIADLFGPGGYVFEIGAPFICGCQTTLRKEFTIFRVTLKTPNGDPTTAAGANATNERVFDAAATGVLTVECEAEPEPNTPEVQAFLNSNRICWSADAIGNSARTWNSPWPGNATKGAGLKAKATFTGLPVNNSEFGVKVVAMELLVDGVTVAATERTNVEVFYKGVEFNHPGGERAHPNWFHYYKQNAGGGTYGYEPAGRSHSNSAGGDGTVRIGSEAYTGDSYIMTSIVGGQLTATGWSGENKYYANFLGVLAHERQHANNETTAGPPTDRDSDWLTNGFETNTSHTNPDDKYSARGSLSGAAFSDDEVYAGGPVEQAGIAGANTSQDWASPGTKKK